MFPKHNGLATISESFGLNLQISVPLTNKYLLHYNANLNNFFFATVKLIEYIFSAVKYFLILALVLFQELICLFSYCQYA